MARMPKVFQVEILLRALGEKGLDSLYDQYKEHSMKVRVLAEPSEKDVRVYNLVRKEKSIGKVAKMLGVTVGKVYGSLARVGAYK